MQIDCANMLFCAKPSLIMSDSFPAPAPQLPSPAVPQADQASKSTVPTGSETPDPNGTTTKKQEDDDDKHAFLKLLFVFLTLLTLKGGRPFVLKALLKYCAWAATAGVLLCAIVSAGSAYAIGIHAWWANYRVLVVLSPLAGIAGGLFMFAMFVGFEAVDRFAGEKILAAAMIVLFVALFAIGGYFGTREENKYIVSQPADMQALTTSATDQKRALGQMSDSGKALVQQLTTTQGQLEDAKQQLTLALGQFHQQKRNTEQIQTQLKDLDLRRQAIETKTAELERILEGRKPITRADLQRSTFTGLIYGAILGFFGSLAASYVLTRLISRAKTPPPSFPSDPSQAKLP